MLSTPLIKNEKVMNHLKNYSKRILAVIIFSFVYHFAAIAQQDTSRRQTIEITSSYKPVLRNTVKINLYASPLNADTSRPRLSYNIPAQNLFLSYEPIALKPLALDIDTTLHMGDRNQLKVGFGSFTTPFVAGAFSFGDGKKNLLNVYGNYISSRGNIVNQDFSEISAGAAGSLFTPKSEIYAKAAFAQHEYYQYGYNHTIDSFNKPDIRRSYQDLSAGIGFRNIAVNDLNVIYDPHMELHAFTRENQASETTLLLLLPAEKKFSESVSFKINATANLDKYENNNASLTITNNLFQIAPELVYYGDMFTFHGGVTPSWNNGVASLLPNIYTEVKLKENDLIVQAGWVGNYVANSFRTLSGENPYIQDPSFLNNTKEVQYYGGIKATVGNHFSFNARAAYVAIHDMPLFINDSTDGKSFYIKNESKMDNLQIHGDMNFINEDKFSLTAGLDMNTYTGLHDNAKAWELIPLQITGSLRWYAFKQLLIKSDLVAFSGAKALLADGSERTLKGGTDLGVGAEFKITNRFSAWLDLDNVLNSEYQRWNNYPVYGLQVIGGILIHF
jgi:hypothetical protein